MLDPWGEQRADARFAALMQMIAVVFGDKAAKLEKFMLFPESIAKQQSPQAQQEAFKRMVAFLGGKVTNG